MVDLNLLPSERDGWFCLALIETNHGHNFDNRCLEKYSKWRSCSRIANHKGPHISGLINRYDSIFWWTE